MNISNIFGIDGVERGIEYFRDEIGKINNGIESNGNFELLKLKRSFIDFVRSVDQSVVTKKLINDISGLRKRIINIEKTRDFQFFSPFTSQLYLKFSDLPGAGMLDYTDKMPSTFWRALAKENSEKSRETQVCLILLSTADHNGVITSAASQDRILKIAKLGHIVAIRKIQSKKLIKSVLEETSSFFEKKLETIIISVHGEPETNKKKGCLTFSQNEPSKNYYLDDVRRDDFDSVDPNVGRVIIDACFSSSFAQKISFLTSLLTIGVKNETIDASTFLGSCSVCSGIALHSLESELVGIETFCESGKKISNCKVIDQDLLEGRVRYLENTIFDQSIADIDDMSRFYKKASSLQRTNFNLFQLYFNNIQTAAKLGFHLSQCEMGSYYESFPYFSKKYLLASKWYQIASENGSSKAQLRLGKAHENGQLRLSKDINLAVQYYTLAASAGEFEAKSRLGVIYASRKMPRQPRNNIQPFLEAAAEDGYPEAQYELGLLYEVGQAGIRDLDKTRDIAFELFLKAARRGYPIAEYKIGLILEQVLVRANRSISKAIKWFQSAAAKNEPRAKKKLFDLFKLSSIQEEVEVQPSFLQ